MPINILELHKNDISEHLSNIFNISASTGIFREKLKLAKLIPIYKKNLKLDCWN